MSALSIRCRLIRLRGSAAAIACVLVLGGAVVAHHSNLPMTGHAGMGMHGVAAMVMCLGVLGLAVLAVASLPGMRRNAAARAPRRLDAREPVSGAHPTRAGPPLFLRLTVLRR